MNDRPPPHTCLPCTPHSPLCIKIKLVPLDYNGYTVDTAHACPSLANPDHSTRIHAAPQHPPRTCRHLSVSASCPRIAARSIYAWSVIMVRFNLYGAHSSLAALDPTWAEGVRRRSVWVLSPAGFAYRRQSPADECAMRRDTGDSLSACA